jgi:hypothetical protein
LAANEHTPGIERDPAQTNHVDDRHIDDWHVVAAAVTARAEVIVTFKLTR